LDAFVIDRDQRAKFLARAADDECVGDVGAELELGLDLGRCDAGAERGGNQTLEPAGDTQHAVVNPPGLAGREPTRLAASLRPAARAPVASKDVIVPDHDLAVRRKRQFAAGGTLLHTAA